MLAFACAFTMFAGAASFTDEADIQALDAVNMLTALGVIEGYEDGSFQPDGTVTRAEMAKMIFVVRNNTIDDSAYENIDSNLTDISNHWAKGYIKFCESQGIIAGKGNGIFDPDATVTGTEAAKMLLVLTGYEPTKAGLTGSAWATNTLKYAGAAGILDAVSSGLASGLPRQYAAQMIYNTLDAWRVAWSTDADAFDYFLNGGEKERVGYAYMGLTKTVGTLVAIDKDSLELADIDKAESDLVETDFTKVGTDYTELLGQKVKVLYKEGKTNQVLGVTPMSDSVVYDTLLNAVEEDNGKIKFDGKSYSIENSGVKVYVDGVRLSVDNTKNNFGAAAFDNDGGDSLFDSANIYDTATAYARDIDNRVSADEVKFVDADGNGKIDTAIISTVDYGKVTYVGSDEIYISSANLTDVADTYKAADNNIASDIEKNDYVVITKNLYQDKNDIVKATELTGVTLEATKADPIQWRLDGTWYVVNRTNTDTVQVGNKIDAFTANGVVLYAKRTSGENAVITDVAMVVAKGQNVQGDQVKIVDFEGKEQIVTFEGSDDAGYVNAQTALAEGAVYELEASGSKYRFKALTETDDWYGDYTAMNTGVQGDATGVTKEDGTVSLNGVAVTDSAKIFIVTNYAGGDALDYKLITGKQFNTLGLVSDPAVDTEILNNGFVTGFTAKVGGVTRVTNAVVKVEGIGSDYITNEHYGYITSDPAVLSGGYIEYTVWTDTEESITVTEKKSNVSGRAKGIVIGYSNITEDNVIEDVTNDLNLVNAAVYGVDGDRARPSKISFNGTTQLDVTDDTVILFVNTKDDVGVPAGDVTDADKIGNLYIQNAMYSETAGDLNVVVIDSRNRLDGQPLQVRDASVTPAEINKQLEKGDVEITVALSADALEDGNTLIVPAETTLFISAPQTQAITVNLDEDEDGQHGMLILNALNTNITIDSDSDEDVVMIGDTGYTKTEYNNAVTAEKAITAAVAAIAAKDTGDNAGTEADPFELAEVPSGAKAGADVVTDLVLGDVTTKITVTGGTNTGADKAVYADSKITVSKDGTDMTGEQTDTLTLAIEISKVNGTTQTVYATVSLTTAA